MSDEFLFAKEEPEEALAEKLLPYSILIVDDDEEIHVITRMALNDFKLDGRPLEFVSAYSGSEAQQLLQERNDFALVLLDVVMENDHAGLDVARWIRDTLKNRMIRIVLRTGQPGQAPEEDIIARYEIDDYKEKTELTYRKLVTLMYSSLRAYRELRTIETNRQALESIIEASSELFTASSIRQLSQGILRQLVSLITHADTAAYCEIDSLTAERDVNTAYQIIAATGHYQENIGQRLQQQVHSSIIKELTQQQQAVCFILRHNVYYGLYSTSAGRYYLLYIEGIKQLSDSDQKLLELFMNNTAIAFEHSKQHNQ